MFLYGTPGALLALTKGSTLGNPLHYLRTPTFPGQYRNGGMMSGAAPKVAPSQARPAATPYHNILHYGLLAGFSALGEGFIPTPVVEETIR
ncbi:unnamed protein product [Nezara viridula]|uniref:Uncharacterized protein n=1 Tax=Nezara viridula TaxID=85310 RepID=A0A9P0EDR8_NEZVI|nr:unnamed protein product [Nezara viridula]